MKKESREGKEVMQKEHRGIKGKKCVSAPGLPILDGPVIWQRLVTDGLQQCTDSGP